MNREVLLRYALIAFGVVLCLVYPLAIVWPSGWAWHEGPPEDSQYFMMIVGIRNYAFFEQAVLEGDLGQCLLQLAGFVHAAILTSSDVASRAVSPASRFLPASRNSLDQR